FRMIINGQPAEARGAQTFEVRNPANIDEVVGVAPKGDAEDVRDAIRAATGALQTSWWPRLHESRRRGKVLQRYAALVEEHKDRLARLLTREQGKIYKESAGELDSLINTFDYYAGYAGKIAGEVKYVRDGDAVIKVETRKQPVGLCAAILPFNFPVSLYAWKVAPALIAGNAVLIKPASTTPLTDIALTALLQEAGVPPGIASIVTGPAGAVGDEILRHPAVKRIAFTGSIEVGRMVTQAASPILKHVTLELGGSDPTVVADDADLEMAAETIVRFGRFRNAGQSCTSVKRVYVFASIYEGFVNLLAQKARALRVGDGLAPETEMGPLNNAAQRSDVERLLADALQRRATVVAGGRRLEEGSHAKGYFFQPTVVVDVADDAALWHEECFGPVLPVMPVRDLEEALERANSTPFGLGSGLWSTSDRTIERFIEGIESGIVWINYKPLSVPETPFGGVKDSGTGRELGAEGLAEYLETKSIRKYIGKA
ncbi:MAG: aldehyde dehydrogenase, partial [Armatimonadetes bacterium]|nr:aldehyde dehydrogenase [Armatimonadota bacterium]